ncbi:unnamed protein product [Heligmosomoides polygyrus]|uniref:Endo/exonuclease/phosphatase domain-containing protein n=1 Tax=Heligmosomoides polygyrus TaxID=6339 RepID=A0A183FN06_HELPZ|nr:unnamed protein product [Heligmosomoides polygyrus]
MQGCLMQGRHRGTTELVRKSGNVSRIRVATLNVGTLTNRSCELVEALECRRVDLCAVQETMWSCSKSRDIGRGIKAVLCGSPRTTRLIASERFRDSIVGVERFNDRLMKIVVAAKERSIKPRKSLLNEKTAEVSPKDVVIVAGGLNGYVKDRDRRLVTDAKVVPYETVVPQHRPLVCT